MSRSATTAIMEAAPIGLQNRQGQRYLIHAPTELTATPAADEKLCRYPLAVFQPPHRAPEETPVVIAVSDLALSYEQNDFLIPTLLDMGLAVVLFDLPFSGERSLIPKRQGDLIDQLVPLHDYRVKITPELFVRLAQVVVDDLRFARETIAERHGLHDSRVALFGAGFGSLLCSLAFLRDGIGRRLLGTIGHADLQSLARSYRPWSTERLGNGLGRWFRTLIAKATDPRLRATLDVDKAFDQFTQDGMLTLEINPMTYVNQSSNDAGARFLVGGRDDLIRAEDAQACADRFANAECFVVPEMDHGGDGYAEHVRFFLHTQLGDWQW